ncbi:MAG: hypothetical protein WCZ43_06765 [Proteiniphilum sp.]
MDEKDFIFVSKPLSKEEDKAFSDFLKNRGKKTVQKGNMSKFKKLSI